MSFIEAVRWMAQETGYWPSGLGKRAEPVPRLKSTKLAAPRKPSPPPPQYKQHRMDLCRQVEAIRRFIMHLEALTNFADIVVDAFIYLASRGIDPQAIEDMGGVFMLPDGRTCRQLAERLIADDPELFIEAGLLKEAEGTKPLRLTWWDRTCIFVCRDRTNRKPLYLIGRRTDPGDLPKYMNQMTRKGAQKYPYGLPSLGRAADFGEELLILEGPIDALGAESIGTHALAMLTRPSAGETHQTSGGAERIMLNLLSDLKRCSCVRILPDNDEGESGAIGIVSASRLAQWLSARGILAEAITMHALGFGQFNDLGEVAEESSRRRAAARQIESDRREVPPGVDREDWVQIQESHSFQLLAKYFGPFQKVTITRK